jgi:hypothetical protein
MYVEGHYGLGRHVWVLSAETIQMQLKVRQV